MHLALPESGFAPSRSPKRCIHELGVRGHRCLCLHKKACAIVHIYPSVLQALPGRGYAGYLIGVILEVLRGLIQDPASELPRIPIPRT